MAGTAASLGEATTLPALAALFSQALGEALPATTLLPAPQAPLRGYLEQLSDTYAAGWAQDITAPDRAVALELVAGGRAIARFLANHYRADLAAAQLGSGAHAFSCRIWPPLTEAELINTYVRSCADGTVLPRPPPPAEDLPPSAAEPARLRPPPAPGKLSRLFGKRKR
jgi:hypothetical protein